MKRIITRTLTMLLTVMMLMGMFVINAGAIAVFDYDYKTDSVDWGNFRPTPDYADYLKTWKPVNQTNAHGQGNSI